MLCNCTYFAYADQKKTVGGEFLLEIFMPIHTNWTEIPRGRWLAESLYRHSRILRRFSFSTVCYGADSIFTQSAMTQIQSLRCRLLRRFSFSTVSSYAESIFTQSFTAQIQFGAFVYCAYLVSAQSATMLIQFHRSSRILRCSEIAAHFKFDSWPFRWNLRKYHRKFGISTTCLKCTNLEA
jgi:hypothetical protein